MIEGLSQVDMTYFDYLNRLFSVVMVMDEDLTVIHGSETLTRHVPLVNDSPGLLHAFKFLRPGSVENFEDVKKQLNSLFLLTAVDGSFAIRGQMICKAFAEREYLFFCGAPWLSWLNTNRPDIKLGIKDFSPQDVQLDQLFYMSTEKRMVEDLERLNNQLQAAKEEVEAAQAAKSAFFAQMSHEMRTPLNGVVSALALMGEQELSGKVQQLLHLARESSRNMMQVVNYVLDVSKIESAEGAADAVEFDLPELVRSVVDIVRARALEKGLDIDSSVEAGLPLHYLGDPARLRQTLLNLVINAVKFTSAGRVAIDVSASAADGQTLRIEVTDTGAGIDKADQKKIFEPFCSLHRQDAGGGEKGTGLGLDIARRNIEFMGGKIGVSSAPAVGSTFWIDLPITAVNRTAPITQAKSEESQLPARLSGTVLLVDDNETNLMLGTMILEGMGLTVVPAASGEEAVDIVRDRAVDLVLMDISMPGIDGFEATRRIRSFRDAQALPVIALTAYASSVEREKSKKCGMDDYLTKPIEGDKLARTLAAWLPSESVQSAQQSEQEGPGNAPPLVDKAVLDHLTRQIGVDNLVSVIMKFCDEATRRWEALEAAASDTDRAREAHTLASTCRSFGLPRVADQLNCIESHARSAGELPEPPCIMATGRQLSQGLVALRTMVERRSAAR